MELITGFVFLLFIILGSIIGLIRAIIAGTLGLAFELQNQVYGKCLERLDEYLKWIKKQNP